MASNNQSSNKTEMNPPDVDPTVSVPIPTDDLTPMMQTPNDTATNMENPTNKPPSAAKQQKYEVPPLYWFLTLFTFTSIFVITGIVVTNTLGPRALTKSRNKTLTSTGTCPVWEIETPTYDWLNGSDTKIGKDYYIVFFSGQVSFDKADTLCKTLGGATLILPMNENYEEIVNQVIEENRLKVLGSNWDKPFFMWTGIKWNLNRFTDEVKDTVYNETVTLKSHPFTMFCDDYFVRLRYDRIVKKIEFNTQERRKFRAFMNSSESEIYLVKDLSSSNKGCYDFYSKEELEKRMNFNSTKSPGERDVSLSFACAGNGIYGGAYRSDNIGPIDKVGFWDWNKNDIYDSYKNVWFQEANITNIGEFNRTTWVLYKAKMTFSEAKRLCNKYNYTLISLENDSIDRYLNFKISDKFFQNKFEEKLNQTNTEEFMWTGGFFNLSDNPYELLWENGSNFIKSLYSTEDFKVKFCNQNITQLIYQQLLNLNSLQISDEIPCAAGRRYLHVIRPYRIENGKSSSCWKLYTDDLLYPDSSNMAFVCSQKK